MSSLQVTSTPHSPPQPQTGHFLLLQSLSLRVLSLRWVGLQNCAFSFSLLFSFALCPCHHPLGVPPLSSGPAGTVLQTLSDDLSPHLISCTVTALCSRTYSDFLFLEEKKKRKKHLTSLPVLFPRPSFRLSHGTFQFPPQVEAFVHSQGDPSQMVTGPPCLFPNDQVVPSLICPECLAPGLEAGDQVPACRREGQVVLLGRPAPLSSLHHPPSPPSPTTLAFLCPEGWALVVPSRELFLSASVKMAPPRFLLWVSASSKRLGSLLFHVLFPLPPVWSPVGPPAPEPCQGCAECSQMYGEL